MMVLMSLNVNQTEIPILKHILSNGVTGILSEDFISVNKSHDEKWKI